MSGNQRLPRPCVKCGFVRLVLVRPKTRAVPTGKTGLYGQPEYEFVPDGEDFEAHCTACSYELNARKYDRLADLNRKRAAEARSKQAIRRLKAGHA